MIDKIKNILTSIRFWQVTIVAAIQVLAVYDIVPQELANVVSGWLGVTVLIGTIDKATGN